VAEVHRGFDDALHDSNGIVATRRWLQQEPNTFLVEVFYNLDEMEQRLVASRIVSAQSYGIL